MYSTRFKLLKDRVPGVEMKPPDWLSLTSEPLPVTPVDSVLECQIMEGYYRDPVTGVTDMNRPVVVVLVDGLSTREIDAAKRDEARRHIMRVGDRFTVIPLIAREQETYVYFTDEKKLLKFVQGGAR